MSQNRTETTEKKKKIPKYQEKAHFNIFKHTGVKSNWPMYQFNICSRSWELLTDMIICFTSLVSSIQSNAASKTKWEYWPCKKQKLGNVRRMHSFSLSFSPWRHFIRLPAWQLSNITQKEIKAIQRNFLSYQDLVNYILGWFKKKKKKNKSTFFNI